MFTLTELDTLSKSVANEVQGLALLDEYQLARMAPRNDKPVAYFPPLYHHSPMSKQPFLSFPGAEEKAKLLATEGYSLAYCLAFYPAWSINDSGLMKYRSHVLRAIHAAGLFPVLESAAILEQNLEVLLKCAGGYGRYAFTESTLNSQKDLDQIERAIQAGWQEIEIGTMFGPNQSVRSEVCRLVAHHRRLIERGVKKVIINLSRVHSVGEKICCSDESFRRAAYILRILCPEGELVINAWETADMRDKLRPFTHIWGVYEGTDSNGCDKRSIQELVELQTTLTA